MSRRKIMQSYYKKERSSNKQAWRYKLEKLIELIKKEKLLDLIKQMPEDAEEFMDEFIWEYRWYLEECDGFRWPFEKNEIPKDPAEIILVYFLLDQNVDLRKELQTALYETGYVRLLDYLKGVYTLGQLSATQLAELLK